MQIVMMAKAVEYEESGFIAGFKVAVSKFIMLAFIGMQDIADDYSE